MADSSMFALFFMLCALAVLLQVSSAQTCTDPKDLIVILDSSQAEAAYWTQTKTFASNFIGTLAINDGTHR